jgi:hypothetical protein
VGQFLYLTLNKVVTNDWFTYLTYQKEHWNNGFSPNLVANFAGYVSNVASWKPADSVCLWIPLVASTFTAVGLLYFAIPRIRISYSAYFLVYLSIYLSTTWLISAPRYLMGVFPVYISLALASRNRAADFAITCASTLLLAYYTLAFAAGHPVM